MERIKTGISGLDEMLMGGMPKNKHTAISGGPGSGKTSFAFEFVYRGALLGENGLYVTLQETEDEMKENMLATFTNLTDINDLVKTGKLRIMRPQKLDLDSIAEIIEGQISENKVKRVVIDSATMVKFALEDIVEYRQTLIEFLALLRGLDCTLVVTIEASKVGKNELDFDVEHFTMDGVINLYNVEQGDRRVRALEILKMRGTDHSRELVPFRVTPEGIKIYTTEKVF